MKCLEKVKFIQFFKIKYKFLFLIQWFFLSLACYKANITHYFGKLKKILLKIRITDILLKLFIFKIKKNKKKCGKEAFFE